MGARLYRLSLFAALPEYDACTSSRKQAPFAVACNGSCACCLRRVGAQIPATPAARLWEGLHYLHMCSLPSLTLHTQSTPYTQDGLVPGKGQSSLLQPALLFATHWRLKPAGAHVSGPPVTVTLIVVLISGAELCLHSMSGVATWVGAGAAAMTAVDTGWTTHLPSWQYWPAAQTLPQAPLREDRMGRASG